MNKLLGILITITLKHSELIKQISMVGSARNFLQQRLVLRRQIPACATCNRQMSIVKCNTSSDGVIFRCPTHKGCKISIRDGSFLTGHHISLTDFILLAYFWAHESRISSVSEMLEFHENTVIQWFSYLRDVCSNYLILFLFLQLYISVVSVIVTGHSAINQYTISY